MPDFGAPIAQNTNPVGQGMQTLSEIMNVKRQQQALQTGQFQQQSAQAEAQQHQQDAGQRQAAAQFFQNYDIASHVGPDGTIDLDKALTNPGLKATGDAYPVIAKSLIDVKNSQLDAKQKLANLDSGLRQTFLTNVAGLSADPDVKQGNNQGVGKVLDAIDEFGQSGGPDAARVAGVYKPIIQNLATSGKVARLPEMLRNFQLQAQSAGEQTAQTYGTPTTVDTGGVIQPGVQAPAAAGGGFTAGGKPIGKTLAPTEQLGYVKQRGAAGVEGTQGASNDESLYNNIVQTGTKATQIKSLSQDVQGLANEVQTGQYSKAFADKWAALAQTFGLPAGATDAATRRQLLSKAAARLKMQSEAGASTDAERAGVDAAMPDPDHMTPQAVQQAARYVGAQADVNSARMELANKHRQINGGASTGLRQTDSQFMQAADPKIFEYQSIPAGKARQDYLRQHFTNAEDLKAFLSKADALKSYGALK